MRLWWILKRTSREKKKYRKWHCYQLTLSRRSCFLLVCLSTGLRKIWTDLIFIKLHVRVQHWPRKDPLNFGIWITGWIHNFFFTFFNILRLAIWPWWRSVLPECPSSENGINRSFKFVFLSRCQQNKLIS